MVTEFLISEAFWRQDDLIVWGICCQGSITLGFHFSEVEIAGGGTQRIDLSVKKIVAYQHEIDELPKGMSGELQFDRRVFIDDLKHGDMLRA